MPPGLHLLASLLSLLLLLTSADGTSDPGSSSHGTLNPEALRKLHFRQAQPPGCKGPGDEARGRWCEVMSDGGVTIRNVERLHEVVSVGEKKEAAGKLVGTGGSNDLAAARREIVAGRAVAAALGTATSKFDKGEKSRLSQKATKSGPASGRKPREADHFKCRKDLKFQDVENLKYVCTVTEYKMRRDAGQSSSKAGGHGEGVSKDKGKGEGTGPGASTSTGGGGTDGGKTQMSDGERCTQLTLWMSKYASDLDDEKRKFWRWLAKSHPSFEALEKLKEHSLNAGTGSGKVRAAIESKATKTYKALSREIHPDKLGSFFRKTPACDKQGVKDMLRAMFDRATDLKNCVLKPLRCGMKVSDDEGGNRRSHDEF